MTWFRRHASRRRSGRSTLLLSSVLALLALACFPVFAQAGGSGEVVYDPSLPSDGGPTQNEKIAKTSETPNNGGAEAPSNTGSGESSESYSEEAVPSEESEGGAAAGGNDDGKGQGKADKGSNPGAQAKVQQHAPVAKATPDTSSDDGGSSPLVPILIGILVLAAISVAVIVRQRRQQDGSGSSLSTKAG